MWKHENTTFSHEILWRAANTALNMTEVEDPRIRIDHLPIHSVLTGFLAFEGFINFVGDEIAPEIWKTERKLGGIIGKIEYLFTLFPNVELKKGEEPYLTFRRVKQTRDDLAHSRVLNYTDISPEEEWSFRTKWEDFDRPEKIRPALQRLKEFAELIRIEAVNLLNEDYALSHLHFKAFEGPLGGSDGKEIG
jgi:hypothetical protein